MGGSSAHAGIQKERVSFPMNETSVSPESKREEYKVLSVWPPQKCYHCDRLTTIVHIDPAFVPNFQPKCALHGLARCPYLDETIEERDAELESVRRFVLWMHADIGRVPLVARLSEVKEIPGYEVPDVEDEEEEENEEIGWATRYEAPDGVRIDSYVASDYDQFFLYENGVLVEQRQIEQVV